MTQHTRAPRRASTAPSAASTAPAPTVREWQILLGDRTPTPVQAQAIPALLDGRDVITTARTGSGKTLAFLIPAAARGIGMRQTRGMQPEALVITPTRELAVQIRDVATELGMTAGRITGGITPGQTTREATGKGLITGTPGRLKDLIGRGELRLNNLRYVVLDEADELLSLGFLRDVGDILRHARDQQPQGRSLQIAMASATFPAEIRDVAQRFMHDPARIDVAPTPGADATGDILGGVSTATHLLQHTTKDALLTDAARHTRAALTEPGGCVVLFSRTKHLVKRRAQHLGDLLPGEQVSPLEGNMDQKKRERTMQALRDGQSRILVATDIAGRGIDLPEVRLVIHLDVAATAEDHVHRSGRTARAGRDGTNLILLAPEQRALWQGIRRKLPAALQPPATPEERQIDPEVQEKRGQGRASQPGRGGQQPRSAQGSSQGQRQGAPRQGQQASGRSEGRTQRTDTRPQSRQDTPGTGAGRVGPQRPKRRR
ncbi:DEAD/DEAH box helicase [Deinococcus soli (ex Cha et al. 2016)]|uniref:DEAD/DEAH box helicase n=1 Tax=Deinococcus soli (ex Cha et al. 2016) TaxID=1309411 RepID=UPI001669FD6C|nr:DEAD/DEAH box helicase [Deinococcus soli (ex Cha et al. 2016)]GGB72158.1 RNA helicase [Deinococcus soli (ex Cha et al. 2016)]